MSKLYFFRHAQASYLADDYDQLSEKGLAQSRLLGKYLADKKQHFDKIFVGPLKRQQQTYQQVQIIYQQHGLSLPEPTELPGLKEHAGTEGVKLAYPQLMQVPRLKALFEEQVADPGKRHRNTLLIFQYFMDEWTEGRITIPGIESWAEFRQMVKKSLDEIFVQTQKGEKIGIFTSGGTISSITAEALKLDREQRVAAMNFSVRNTSFSTFFYSRGQFNLLSFNELPHLPEEMITFV